MPLGMNGARTARTCAASAPRAEMRATHMRTSSSVAHTAATPLRPLARRCGPRDTPSTRSSVCAAFHAGNTSGASRRSTERELLRVLAAEQRAGDGFVPSAFEFAFGRDREPPPLELAGCDPPKPERAAGEAFGALQ